MPEPITLIVIGALISAGIGGLSWWLKRRISTRDRHYNEVEDLRKAVWRLNKTVLILAKMLDNISKKTHPEFQSELEEIARELLSTTDDYEETA